MCDVIPDVPHLIHFCPMICHYCEYGINTVHCMFEIAFNVLSAYPL